MEEFLKPGQEVKFKRQFAPGVGGIIKAVWISNHGVLYQVQYFIQGKMEEPYVMKEMFDTVDEQPAPAGFRLNGPKFEKPI